MLKIKDKELKKLLMQMRYDDLFGKDHELYEIKDDGIEFSIDAPTDIGKGDIFTLFISDEEVNKSGVSPLDYYEAKIYGFTRELYRNYSRAIEDKLMKELDKAMNATLKKYRGTLGGQVSFKLYKAGTTEDQFCTEWHFKYGKYRKKATSIVSIADTATLKSIRKELIESFDKIFQALKGWVAKCNAKETEE